MDYRQTAEAILAGVGGAANIAHLEHCSTRLRFTLRDSGAARVEELQKIPGVLGVVMTAQCQVIIGNQVVEVYEALTPLLSGNNATSVAPDAPVPKRKAGDVVLDFMQAWAPRGRLRRSYKDDSDPSVVEVLTTLLLSVAVRT